jgi:adenylate cyclase, class 2
MIEVEVKARVTDFQGVKKKLSQMGILKVKTEFQEDIYYNAPHRDFGQTDEALRIRKIPDNNGFKTFLTYKGAKMDDTSKTRKEIEVVVENRENTASILENLGFIPVVTIKKKRMIYEIDDLVICLDDVDGVGTFVEIERGLKEGEDFQDSLEEIFKTYRKLGITDGFVRKSYLELLGIH